jgi:SAM-dependent methyltransferase
MPITPPYAHPASHVPLVQEAGGWRCPKTGELFPVRNGAPVFVPQSLQEHMDDERHGLMNGLKTFLRKFPKLYIALIYIVSPICFVGQSAKSFVKEFRDDQLLINIGSGIHIFGPNVLNLDIFWYKGVDIVGDAMALPFATGGIDGVICEYLIEHVPDPQKVVDEIVRVLKPGGKAYLAAPFVYPFHASPNDFNRWSVEGAKILCKRAGAQIDIVAPRSGPTSALVAQLGTWAAIVFSFGNDSLYSILNVVFTTLFSPLKWLDVIFGRFPTAIHGPGSWYAIIRKP